VLPPSATSFEPSYHFASMRVSFVLYWAPSGTVN